MRALCQRFVVVLGAAATAVSCTDPVVTTPPSAHTSQAESALEARAERAAARATRASVVLPAAAIPSTTGQDIVNALDIPAALHPTFVSGTSPDPFAAFVVGGARGLKPTFGTVQPTRGDSFVVLSTGRSGDDGITAEPGTDFGAAGTADDVVTVRIQVTVPPNVNRMSFDYTFLSAESPEFVGTGFNDAFTVTVSDGLGPNRPVLTVSIDDADFHPVSATSVGRGPFFLFDDDPSGVNFPPFAGPDKTPDAGTTGVRRVDVAVAPGPLTLQFDIRDVGDGSLDSAVAIDNVQFSVLEAVDPVHGMIDPFSGRVVADDSVANSQLVTSDPPVPPVSAVAADGVTQLVLRSNVPDPGTATFTVVSGADSDGRLSADTGPPVWAASAVSRAVQINGQWYVFALYRSPPDFNRGGDELADRRTVALRMTYQSTGTTRLSQDYAIDLVRPPLVIVPDMWSELPATTPACVSALEVGGFMDSKQPDLDRLFHPACVDYAGTASKSLDLEDNRRAIADMIHQVLRELRASNIAATRADVIGYGMGGLLARRYLEEDGFRRYDNFNAGEINRLILVDSPQLGSRLVDAFVTTRNSVKTTKPSQWDSLKKQLAKAGVLLDDADGDLAFQEMGTGSKIVNGVGVRAALHDDVFYHAVIGTGGHDLVASEVNGLVPAWMKAMSFFLGSHPALAALAPKDRVTAGLNMVYGVTDPRTSGVFCSNDPTPLADQHDLFLTTWEQQGGLDPAFTSFFQVSPADTTSSHFRVMFNAAHRERLVALLNAPVHGGAFSTSMPLPSQVDRKNDCPIGVPQAAFARGAAVVQAAIPPTIAITSPAPATTVTPGATVAVTVTPGDDRVPAAVLIMSEAEGVVVDAPPFVANVHVPASAGGVTTLDAIALYDDGDMAFADPVELTVHVTATLTSLQVLNGHVVLRRPGRTRQIAVLGTYSDGVLRDITRPALGTTYAVSQLRPVATVSPDGLVTGIGPGIATLAISNGPVGTSIDIEVGEPACGDGVLDPGEQCDDGNVTAGDHCDPSCQVENSAPVAVCASPQLCTDPGACVATAANLAAGSSDPDGDPLVFTQSPQGPYPVSVQAVTVRVSDGQLATECTSQLDVRDCEQPQVSCPADFAVECVADGAAPVAPPPATATDNCSVSSLQPPAAGPQSLGPHALAYTATDPSGNAASCTTTVTVVDTTPPDIACPAPVVAECSEAGHASVDPGAAHASDRCTAAAVTAPGTQRYPLGASTVTYAATDLVGNHASCSTTVTVQDTTAPALACPPDRVAECTAGGKAVVDPGDAIATDRCTTASVSHPGAGAYALGVTAIEYVAVDEAGNRAGCTSHVTVQDITPPALACPAPSVAECTADSQAIVDPGDAIATEACTRATVSHPGAASYPLGTTAVDYAARDEAGNQSACRTTVTVQDTLPPEIRCPPPVVAECTGASSAFVRPGQATASDLCTPVTVTRPGPRWFPLGETMVDYTASDATGHQASCHAAIDVVDTLPPRVVAERSPALGLPDHGYRTVSLDDCAIAVEDACGGRLPVSVSRPTITCVTSDEPDDARGGGDGRTTDDIVLVDDTRVRLRAERDLTGDGRVYQIHVQARDRAGNLGDGVCSVFVPRDPSCSAPGRRGDRECRVTDSGVAHSVCAH